LPLLAQDALPPQIRFTRGPINSVTIGFQTAVYGSPAAVTQVLLTHARRDSIGSIPPNARLFVPAGEKELFDQPQKFWESLETARFHDYAQHSTKVQVRRYGNTTAVADGDEIPVEGAKVRAISTPGYTPGAISYVIDAGGKRVICTGDLI